MPVVFYSPAANEDLLAIAEYIARDKPAAARRWVQRIQETCELLATQPNLGESRSGFGAPTARMFSVGNYVIFFRAVNGGIEVSRIVHASRDWHNL
ncbi:type II toxin-antitoxin system RelE/ParE family toxin [Anatilimnocola floriformis]|uniref:type II toxin-antitoxin system RelE/ParE family toxin n=1 Tax=Anatilimnocola floriformis TaxID=2948575 RepID=UPI0020C4EF8A|nr:type II toxin-antitoxin system RelE/ParE family toxin [Anatilimnocola floriformis]